MSESSRPVGRPTNNPSRMEPRSVPVQHDKARINDQRKVRPHKASEPAMGTRPSGGAQKSPKKPALGKGRMQAREVPIERMTEAELAEWNPFNMFRRQHTKAALPTHDDGDVLAWHRSPQGIHVIHVRDGVMVGKPTLVYSDDILNQKMQDAMQQYNQAKGEMSDLRRRNPKSAGLAAIAQYAKENNIRPKRVGEWGVDINPSYSSRARDLMNPRGQARNIPIQAGPPPGQNGSPSPARAPSSPSIGNSKGTFTQSMNWGNQPNLGGFGNAPNHTGRATPIVDPLDGTRDRQRETRQEMNMPLSGIPVDKIDEILRGAHANGLDKGRWTDAMIAGSSELNKRQSAAKLFHKNVGANPNRVHESQLDELWLMKNRGTPEPQLDPRDVIRQIREMGLKVGYMDGQFTINYPSGAHQNAFKTKRPYNALKTAQRMRAIMMREAYPDTSYETDEPAHEAKVGDSGWFKWRGHTENPKTPDLNKEYMGAYELHVEKIHEVANAEIEKLLRGTAARLGYKDVVFAEEVEERPETPQNDGAVSRVRARWVGEAEDNTPRNYPGFRGPQQAPPSVTASGPSAVQNWQQQAQAIPAQRNASPIAHSTPSGVRPASGAPSGVRPASGAPSGVRPASGAPSGVRPASGAAPSGRSDQNTMALQRNLKGLGFDVGRSGTDGVMGNDTRAAMKAAQAKGYEFSQGGGISQKTNFTPAGGTPIARTPSNLPQMATSGPNPAQRPLGGPTPSNLPQLATSGPNPAQRPLGGPTPSNLPQMATSGPNPSERPIARTPSNLPQMATSGPNPSERPMGGPTRSNLPQMATSGPNPSERPMGGATPSNLPQLATSGPNPSQEKITDSLNWNDYNNLFEKDNPNLAGSGKDFRAKPGVNKSKKQPGNLVGSRKVNKVKPGFVG